MTNMQSLLQGMLDVAEALFTDPAVNRPFQRVEITHGPPSWVCNDELSLYLKRRYTTSPFTTSRTRPSTVVVVPAAEVVFTLLRCVTVLTKQKKHPSAATVTTQATELANDAEILYQGIARAAMAGTLVPQFEFERFTFKDMTPLGPMVDTGGYQFSIELTLG